MLKLPNGENINCTLILSAFYLEVVLKDHQSHMAFSVQLGALLLESTPEECDIGPPNEANE